MISDRNRPRSRRLSADEHRLWTSVTQAMKPLKPSRNRSAGEASDADARPDERATQPVGSAAPLPAKKSTAPPPLAPLERRLRQRLAKGNEPIERRLDLHGLTQREAHAALTGFLRSAQAQGAKVVLVVTGKGMRGADRDPFAERGVLRRLVPQWLNAPELRSIVVGFDAAHIGHGGEGALYVRLRRPRS